METESILHGSLLEKIDLQLKRCNNDLENKNQTNEIDERKMIRS
jgi:hypothetical protein